MKITSPNIVLLAATLGLASIYGIWHRSSRGKFKAAHTGVNQAIAPLVTPEEIEDAFGSKLTLVQFSSAFCTPCRATRALLTDITADLPDVVHVDVDAESHLELVRRLDIRSTPTTVILNKDGHEVGRAVGAPKRQQVLDVIASLS